MMSRHWKISTDRHFQNGHHNTAKIQHCLISSKFDMWVDYDVPNWFLTLKNFYRLPFSKWPPQYCTNSTLFDFNILNWFPTSKNFYRSSFSKWPPQYRKNSTLFDFNVLNWFPTSKNFYLSLFSKWLSQYRKNSTLFDFKGSFWFIFLNLLSVAGLGDSIIVRL